jgi:hypothetical protein
VCDRAASYRDADPDVPQFAQTILVALLYVAAIATLIWATKRMK